MEYYPVYSYSPEQLSSVKVQLQNKLAEWTERWLPTTTDIRLQETDTGGYKKSTLCWHQLAGKTIGFEENLFSEELFSALFLCRKNEQTDETLALTNPVEQACRQELFTVLLGSTERPDTGQATPAGFARKWSGWLTLHIVCSQQSLALHLSPQLIRNLLSPELKDGKPSGQPLANRTDAIAQQRVALTAELGPATLPVGELAQLQVGDVILLDRTVADSVTLKIDADHIIGQGVLCQHQNHRALLVKKQSS